MQTDYPIPVANELVDIVDVCKLIGMQQVDYASSGAKVRCPFADLYHTDRADEKTFRIYDSNSSYCFACLMVYTPTKLLSTASAISEEESAETLLRSIGYVPPTYESKWEDLMTEQVIVDTDALAEALKLACARMDPAWEIRQFDDTVGDMLGKCLRLLSSVKTAEDATNWLTGTKKAMKRILEIS